MGATSPTTPTTLTYLASNENGSLLAGDNDGTLDFADAYAAICFAAGTRLETPSGPRKVEDLRPGDLVQTVDQGARPLLWAATRRFTAADLVAAAHQRPVSIQPGALAPGIPSNPLYLSPQHRVLLRSATVRRITGKAEVLVPARLLCGHPRIGPVLPEAPEGVLYVHLLFDRHHILLAHGAQVESLLLGTQARRSLSAADQVEITRLLPAMAQTLGPAVPARPLSDGKTTRRLVRRHLKENRPMFC